MKTLVVTLHYVMAVALLYRLSINQELEYFNHKNTMGFHKILVKTLNLNITMLKTIV